MGAMQAAKLLAELGTGERVLSEPLAGSPACKPSLLAIALGVPHVQATGQACACTCACKRRHFPICPWRACIPADLAHW